MAFAKKSLGQNFLNSRRILEEIVEIAEISGKDIVLEVGPGKGSLTEKLLEKAGKVIAVEKDDRLIPFLTEKFTSEISSGKFILVHGDILNLQPTTYNLQPNKFKIVANIPYYITGSFLRKFLSCDNQPKEMLLMVQKEVADRIVARDKKESILSISVKVYGEPFFVKKIAAGNFTPAPKVDSALLQIKNISKKNFENIDEGLFFEIVKAGFGQKRKMLLGNLKNAKNGQKTKPELSLDMGMEKIFKNCDIPPKTRAEDLSLEKWLRLAKNL